MGYGQRVEGTITIHPPIEAPLLRVHKKLTAPGDSTSTGRRDAYIAVEKAIQETDDGEITRLTGTRIIVAHPESEFSRYTLAEDIQEIISTFPDRTYTGRLLLTGEDGGQSAIIIRNGTAREVEPVLVWPDDEGNSNPGGIFHPRGDSGFGGDSAPSYDDLLALARDVAGHDDAAVAAGHNADSGSDTLAGLVSTAKALLNSGPYNGSYDVPSYGDLRHPHRDQRRADPRGNHRL